MVVVGGGYTGMWAAWHMKQLEPEARVVLLEADRCGYGPSGRNGGFCNVMWFSLPNMRERWGDAEALAVARAAEEAVVGIGEFCEGEGVDAWFRPGRLPAGLDGARRTTVSGARRWRPAASLAWTMRSRRCRRRRWRSAALRPPFAAGPSTPAPRRCSRRGWRSGCASGCVRAASRSASARRCGGSQGSWTGVEAHTAGGVGAGRAPRCWRSGRGQGAGRAAAQGRLTVASSHIVLTEPVPELLEEIGWTGGECITDSRALIDYFRTTPDGRIAFGWGGGRIAMGARLRRPLRARPRGGRPTAAHLWEYFPGLAGRRLTHAWGGPIDASPTHLPLVVPLRGGRAFAAAGYTGNGVGPSHMVGRTLASLALDRRDEPLPPGLRRPLAPHESPRALPLARRRGDPQPASYARRKPSWPTAGPTRSAPCSPRIPELIGFHIGR